MGGIEITYGIRLLYCMLRLIRLKLPIPEQQFERTRIILTSFPVSNERDLESHCVQMMENIGDECDGNFDKWKWTFENNICPG